jgi:uncharacterized protein (DUF2249 family)
MDVAAGRNACQRPYRRDLYRFLVHPVFLAQKERFNMATPSSAQNHGTSPVVDVREIAPRDRHPLIFTTFDRLQPGQALILVNDHDPKPLHYQFRFERQDQFEWEYLDAGPEVWRVRIGKV